MKGFSTFLTKSNNVKKMTGQKGVGWPVNSRANSGSCKERYEVCMAHDHYSPGAGLRLFLDNIQGRCAAQRIPVVC